MNIVIGAIVGSDIYIVPGLTAGLIGPFAIVIWILAGIVSMVLVMVFAYCSYYVPKVGGPFAFVSTAFDDFYGFIAGWSMAIAEIVALPVFAIVFTNYLSYFVNLPSLAVFPIRIAFVIILVAVNIVGVKAAGRVNDVLTLAKLTPLLIVIVLGIGSILINPSLRTNYTPFMPNGLDNFGTALVLIFWAYAGFELGSLPSDEVENPKKNIPKAIITGMLIVVFFYVMTAVTVFGIVKTTDLANSPIPLVFVSIALLGSIGGTVTTVGALASVSGTDETEVLGTARLLYAMSRDQLLPKAFNKVHPRFQTPHIAIIIEGVIAVVLSLFSGIGQLISFAVFNLAVCYLLVCLSLPVLAKTGEHGLHGQRVLPWIGVGISLYLAYSTSLFDKAIGISLVLIGIPIYLYFSPRAKAEGHKHLFVSEAEVVSMNLQRRNKSLLAALGRLKARINRRGGG
jgi:basic amino acid/polyamine antiporter, APA family